jgi:lantibiotic modifying enzyme
MKNFKHWVDVARWCLSEQRSYAPIGYSTVKTVDWFTTETQYVEMVKSIDEYVATRETTDHESFTMESWSIAVNFDGEVTRLEYATEDRCRQAWKDFRYLLTACA